MLTLEVMLALTTIAISLTPIFITQGSMAKRVSNEARAIKRLMYAQQYLYENEIELKQQKAALAPKEIRNPSMRISYKETPPAKESALSKYPNIMLRTIQWSWQQDGKDVNDALITLAYKAPLKESAEKGS